MLKMHVKTF